MSFQGIHTNCRNGVYPRSQVQRFPVPDNKVSWLVQWEEYSPVNYTDSGVLKASWADKDISSNFEPKFNCLDGDCNRRSYVSRYEIVDQRPRNPIGRTGVTGRGRLGRWGPNHAGDAVVTRWKRHPVTEEILQDTETAKPILQFIAILRRHGGQWAIPGGMVDPGEEICSTLRREFEEEALDRLGRIGDSSAEIRIIVNKLFADGRRVYQGYVDDPRNTDNAWMETTAENFHDPNGLLVDQLPLKAGDDAENVCWTDVDSRLQLYASHRHILKQVAIAHNAYW